VTAAHDYADARHDYPNPGHDYAEAGHDYAEAGHGYAEAGHGRRVGGERPAHEGYVGRAVRGVAIVHTLAAIVHAFVHTLC
jgi:hypothetical protein